MIELTIGAFALAVSLGLLGIATHLEAVAANLARIAKALEKRP